METRAKYVLIGAFVVGVCAIGLFLLLWAGKHSMDREFAHYDVYFREAITGLSKGGPVYYNGIQVGEVSALRLSQDVPQIKEALQGGNLSLQVVAQAQTFLNQERKHNHKTYTREQKSDLVQQLHGKSAREAEKILIAKSPDLPRPERSRQLTPSSRQVTLTVTEQLDRKLKNLRSHFSHKK